MEDSTLYVKSKRISVHKSPILEVHHGHVFGTFSETIQTMVNYLPEDQEAIDLLKQPNLAYRLVDLNACPFMARVKARIIGIRTPTLVLNGRKIVGVENIKQALKDVRGLGNFV